MIKQFCQGLMVVITIIQVLSAETIVESKRVGLMGVYQDALNNNADLAMAKAQYQIKQELTPQAMAGLLPQLTGSATYGDIRTSLDQPASTSRRNNHLYGLSLSQPVFRLDRWFQLQMANAETEQARLEFAVFQQQLILKTAQLYFNVLQAQDDLAAVKAEELAYKKQHDQALARFNLGLADRTDLLQALSAYDMARAKRIVSQRKVLDGFQALENFSNRRYKAIAGINHNLPIKKPMPNDAKKWVDKSLLQNISLQAGSHGVTAAEKSLKQRKAGHAPTIDLVASYKRGDNDAFTGFSNGSNKPHYGYDISQRMVGLELQIPIYSGGATSSKIREARATLTKSEYQQESLKRQVVQDARDLHRAVNVDVEEIKALKQAIVSSQSAVEATEIGFDVGTRNIIDVLDAQRRLYDAVRNYNNARYAYIIDVLKLKQIIGTLSPADLQALEGYLSFHYDPDRDFFPSELIKKSIR